MNFEGRFPCVRAFQEPRRALIFGNRDASTNHQMIDIPFKPTVHGQIIPLEQTRGSGPSHSSAARPGRKRVEGGTYQWHVSINGDRVLYFEMRSGA